MDEGHAMDGVKILMKLGKFVIGICSQWITCCWLLL